MEFLFDSGLDDPVRDAPVIPLGEQFFNNKAYQVGVAREVVAALSLPAMPDNNAISLPVHFSKYNPTAADVDLSHLMPFDVYAKLGKQDSQSILSSLIDDAKTWCSSRTYGGQKLSTDTITAHLINHLSKKLASFFVDAPFDEYTRQKKLNSEVFGVSAPSSSALGGAALKQSEKPLVGCAHCQGRVDCGYCEAGKKKKAKKEEEEVMGGLDWRKRSTQKLEGAPPTLRPLEKPSPVRTASPVPKAEPVGNQALPADKPNTLRSLTVMDPKTGAPVKLEMKPLEKNIFANKPQVAIEGSHAHHWKEEYFGRIEQANPLTTQFLEYAARSLNANPGLAVTDLFLPSEAQLLSVQTHAASLGKSFPFERMWQVHAAVRETDTRLASLSPTVGKIYTENNTLSIQLLNKHDIQVTERKTQQLGNRTVTVHIHSGLFIPQQ